MKESPRVVFISLLLVLAQLFAPVTPALYYQQHFQRIANWYEFVSGTAAHAQSSGTNTLFLPLTHVASGPPDFEIINPRPGGTVSGMMYFAAQPTDPATVSSVTFRVGSTFVATDTTSANGFRVYLHTDAF